MCYSLDDGVGYTISRQLPFDPIAAVGPIVVRHFVRMKAKSEFRFKYNFVCKIWSRIVNSLVSFVLLMLFNTIMWFELNVSL